MFIYNAGWIPQVDEEGNLVQEQSNVEDSTIYLAFLTEAYKPRAYWFVVPENTRRLMLSSALIVFAVEDEDQTPQADMDDDEMGWSASCRSSYERHRHGPRGGVRLRWCLAAASVPACA